MKPPFDSVYPDFLKTGLGILELLDARRELLALFSALGYFRHDLHAADNPDGILQVGQRYVAGLNLFDAIGFWLVNTRDYSFEPALAVPEAASGALQEIVNREIRSGRFAAALRQNAPVTIQAGTAEKPERGILHALALSSQAVGMFCGILRTEVPPSHEAAFSLLSLLLGEVADALATLNKTAQLTSQIETLTGMLPLCAWCKKVRDDRGYWEQIDKYVSSRTAASFSHGICPDCEKKLLGGTRPVPEPEPSAQKGPGGEGSP
jgi:hypothetical protein